MSNPSRTNPQLVQDILQRDYRRSPDSAAALQAGIAAASAIVDQVVAISQTSSCQIPLTDAIPPSAGIGGLPELIERWLAAHYYLAGNKALAQSSTAGASGSFQGQKQPDGLDTTEYGRRARQLDVSGALTMFDKRQVASSMGGCRVRYLPGRTIGRW